jgi:hypothetical protein
MALNPRLWRPVAMVLSAANLAAVGFHAAIEQGEMAAVHGLLAAGAAYWAARLGRTRTPALENPVADERMEQLEAELMQQRHELADAQERLDFAERLLSQSADRRRDLQG